MPTLFWRLCFNDNDNIVSVNLLVLLSLVHFISPSRPPPPPPLSLGTMSLPWLGGCNLLQAAGQAEKSPSYLDKGSPKKIISGARRV